MLCRKVCSRQLPYNAQLATSLSSNAQRPQMLMGSTRHRSSRRAHSPCMASGALASARSWTLRINKANVRGAWRCDGRWSVLWQSTPSHVLHGATTTVVREIWLRVRVHACTGALGWVCDAAARMWPTLGPRGVHFGRADPGAVSLTARSGASSPRAPARGRCLSGAVTTSSAHPLLLHGAGWLECGACVPAVSVCGRCQCPARRGSQPRLCCEVSAARSLPCARS